MSGPEDFSESEPFDRDRWERPLIPDPDTGVPVAYMRTSKFAGLLTDKFLESYHLWWGAKTAALYPAESAPITAAASHKGHATAMKELVHRAGMHEKRDRGQARHTLVRWALTGRPLPDGMTDEQRGELQHVVDTVRSLGDLKAVEVPLVCDELRVAGQADYVGEGVDGPFIADLKTGSYYKGGSGIEWGLQLVAYARSRRWDRATKTRGDWICPTLPRLYVIHAPQDDSSKVDVYQLDPQTCWDLAKTAVAVRDARLIDPIWKDET